MKRALIPTTLSTLLLLIAAASSAEEQPLIKVELLIFSQNDESMLESLKQTAELSKEVMPPAISMFEASTERSSRAEEFQISSDYDLSAEYDKIEKDDTLELLFRIAWVQPQYEDSDSVFVKLLHERQGSLLEGVARLSHRKLYLLELKFRYDSTDDVFTEQNKPENQDSMLLNFRKIAVNGKIYYIDHALIGILMQITEIEPEPAPESEDPPATQSAGETAPESETQPATESDGKTRSGTEGQSTAGAADETASKPETADKPSPETVTAPKIKPATQ